MGVWCVGFSRQKAPSHPKSTPWSIPESSHQWCVILLNINRRIEGSSLFFPSCWRWVPDVQETTCQLCATYFTCYRRRHHCRACGRLICRPCSRQKITLPIIGYQQPERICHWAGCGGILGHCLMLKVIMIINALARAFQHISTQQQCLLQISFTPLVYVFFSISGDECFLVLSPAWAQKSCASAGKDATDAVSWTWKNRWCNCSMNSKISWRMEAVVSKSNWPVPRSIEGSSTLHAIALCGLALI